VEDAAALVREGGVGRGGGVSEENYEDGVGGNDEGGGAVGGGGEGVGVATNGSKGKRAKRSEAKGEILKKGSKKRKV
jgi:hypothetical protein